MQGEALDPLQEPGPLGRALGRTTLHLVRVRVRVRVRARVRARGRARASYTIPNTPGCTRSRAGSCW